MTSILIEATRFLEDAEFVDRSGAFKRSRFLKGAEFIVYSRGVFNSVVPRMPKLPVFVAMNADTYHLSRQVFMRIAHYDSAFDVRYILALGLLTQAQEITFEFFILAVGAMVACINNVIGPQLVRLASTLECLSIPDFFPHSLRGTSIWSIGNGAASDALAPFLALLLNLRVVDVPLKPAVCQALAAGPGQGLRELNATWLLECQVSDFDAVVSGCTQILRLRIAHCEQATLLPVVSKLRFLQMLVILEDRGDAFFDGGTEELQQCLSELPCLTHLEMQNGFCGLDDGQALALATAVGGQLRVLTIRTESSSALATICCAASFPLLEKFTLIDESYLSHDVVVSLSSRLSYLELTNVKLSSRTLKQLLTGKPNLKELDLYVQEEEREAEKEQQGQSSTAAEQNDWFVELAKSPLQCVKFSDIIVRPSMVQRIGQLAATLTKVEFEISEWLPPLRDQFLGELCRTCVLLKSISITDAKMPGNRSPERCVDTSVAFAGLRNNEQLSELQLYFCASSIDPIVAELLEMRSREIAYLCFQCSRSGPLPSEFQSHNLSLEQCIRLGERFVHLRAVQFIDQAIDKNVLRRRFPLILWS